MAQNKNNNNNNKYPNNILSSNLFGMNFLIDFFSALGMFGIYVGGTISRIYRVFYSSYIRRYVYKLDAFGLRIVKFFSKISRAVSFKFYMFAKFFVDAKNVIVKGYRKNETAFILVKLFNAFVAFCKGVINNRHIFVTITNYALPIIAIAAFSSILTYVSSLNFAVSVEYNGEHVGYVENETVFERAETKLQERMIYLENDEAINKVPKFAVAVIDGEPLKSDLEMTDTIIQSSSGNIVKAVGLSIDGVFYGAVKNGQALKTELNKMRDKYRTNTEGEEVDFAKEVTTEPGFFLATNIVDEAAVMEIVTKQEQKDVYYEVIKGDTPIMIASKNEMELDEIVALNSGILEDCQIGKKVLVKKSQSFLPVKVTRTESYTADVPFQTVYKESNTLFVGTQKVTKEGENGKNSVTARVSYVDGSEVDRKVTRTVELSAPITQIVTKGTKPMPRISGFTGKISDSGFVWPVSGGYISQEYRGYSHNGFDYAYRGNGYGQPIVAAIPGTVVYSGDNGSYGKLVRIKSPGGIETWYAHCSKLLVSVGQTVEQGEQIANIGSTGRSTGNHLHFRVLVNGAQQDPRRYLP